MSGLVTIVVYVQFTEVCIHEYSQGRKGPEKTEQELQYVSIPVGPSSVAKT